jgi:hypothetical protein
MTTEMIVRSGALVGELTSEERPAGKVFAFRVRRGDEHVFGGDGFATFAQAAMAMNAALVEALMPAPGSV